MTRQQTIKKYSGRRESPIAQDCRAHIINHSKQDTAEIHADVGVRQREHVLRRVHRLERHGRKDKAHHHEDQADNQAHGDGRMYSLADILAVARAVELRDDDRRTGRQAHEEPNQQVDDGACRAADCRKRLRADEIADYNGIHRIVELLKKSPEQDRKKEDQKLFPNNAFRDSVLCGKLPFHVDFHNLLPLRGVFISG